MKNLIRGLMFWLSAIVIILIVSTIAQALAEIITMNFIMNIVYIMLSISIVYILKNI